LNKRSMSMSTADAKSYGSYGEQRSHGPNETKLSHRWLDRA
jgi:hypothetical protein